MRFRLRRSKSLGSHLKIQETIRGTESKKEKRVESGDATFPDRKKAKNLNPNLKRRLHRFRRLVSNKSCAQRAAKDAKVSKNRSGFNVWGTDRPKRADLLGKGLLTYDHPRKPDPHPSSFPLRPLVRILFKGERLRDIIATRYSCVALTLCPRGGRFLGLKCRVIRRGAATKTQTTPKIVAC
jgi:hypothetical protein